MVAQKVCLIACLLPVCAMLQAKEDIIRTDVTPNTHVSKDEEGNYILEDGGVYAASGILNADIKGSGYIVLRIEDGTVINGCVDLQCATNNATRRFPRIWIDYTCQATINNPGKVALKTGHYVPTFIEYCGTLIVNGELCGRVQLTDGGTTLVVNGDMSDGSAYLYKETWLRVKGTIGEGVGIRAEFGQNGREASITNSYATDGDYKVFYGGDDPDDIPALVPDE